MRLSTGPYVLGALQLSLLAVQALEVPNAVPDGGVIEFRIRKPRVDVAKRDAEEHWLGEVTSAELLGRNPESSGLFRRSDTTPLQDLEAIIQHRTLTKRQTKRQEEESCEPTKEKKSCFYKTMYWSEDTQKCEDCPAGEQADAMGTACVGKKTDKDENVQGKCPEGQKLDPKVPNQDEFTADPKCVDKDDNTCPKGESMTRPDESGKTKCVKDDKPDFKCEKDDTEDPKEAGPDGKMKHSCRSTEKKEKDKKETFNKNSKELRDKRKQNNKDRDERRRKISARRGFCLALGAVTWIDNDDFNQLTQLEIDGLVEPDESMPSPDADIQEYMVKMWYPATVTGIEMETAGFGGIIKALSKLLKNVGGKMTRAVATSYSNVAQTSGKMVTRLRTTTKGFQKASKEAIDKAKNSKTVDKIIKDEKFMECVGLAAEMVSNSQTRRAEKKTKWDYDVEGMKVTVDMNAPKPQGNEKPSPEDQASKAIVVVLDKQTDAGEDGEPDFIWQTWPDNYKRDKRVPYEGCLNLNSLDNSITLVQVWGGCCAFYDDHDCKKKMFTQTNRENGQLRGDHNDAVSSFWCTFDENCSGSPQ